VVNTGGEECYLDPMTGMLIGTDGQPLPIVNQDLVQSPERHVPEQQLHQEVVQGGSTIILQNFEGVEDGQHVEISLDGLDNSVANKVILLLPSGQMILSDLTDEEYVKLNQQQPRLDG
jgi:hypothetical protein